MVVVVKADKSKSQHLKKIQKTQKTKKKTKKKQKKNKKKNQIFIENTKKDGNKRW